MKTTILSIICILVSLQYLKAQIHSHDDHVHQQHNHQKKSNLIENKGQWPRPVLFNSSIEGGKVWIQQNKFVYHLQDFSSLHENHARPIDDSKGPLILKQDVVHLNFVGSQKVEQIRKSNRSEHVLYVEFVLANTHSNI